MLLGRRKEYVKFHILYDNEVLMMDKMRHIYTQCALPLQVGLCTCFVDLLADSWFLQRVDVTPCWPGNYYFCTFWCGRKCTERLH